MLAFCALLLLTGCGNSRTPVPGIPGPAFAGGFHQVSLPAAGLRFEAPNSWSELQREPPLVAVLSSGQAVVAVWTYRSSGPTAQLAARRARLIRAARARDPNLQLIRTRTLRLAGAPAIELDALEHIAGQLRRVRSTHLFVGAAELVLDEYAPPDLFHAVDHAVFSPLKRSVVLVPARPGAA